MISPRKVLFVKPVDRETKFFNGTEWNSLDSIDKSPPVPIWWQGKFTLDTSFLGKIVLSVRVHLAVVSMVCDAQLVRASLTLCRREKPHFY